MSYEETSNKSPAIRIRNLSKRYPISGSRLAFVWQLVRGRSPAPAGSYPALDDITISVRQGESVAIIGKNGSGKSTLLELIAGTIFPSSGSLEVRGKVTGLLELGAGFHPDYSGRENVFSYGALLGLSPEELREKYDEIVSFADIGEFIDQPVKIYSSGMYVRLAFAVAALVDPDILLIDEALAVGDILYQQKCIRHLKTRLGSMTLLFVTHNLNLVSTLAERAIVLDQGRIVYDGAPKEALEHYIQLIHDSHREPNRSSPASGIGSKTAKEGVAWLDIAPAHLTGRQTSVISKFAVVTDAGAIPSHVTTGDRIIVHMQVTAMEHCPEALFGYLVADRFGNYIFGENTYNLEGGVCELESGRSYHIRFDFEWPEVKPGEYTLTLGVGEGADPMHHVVQCWAQNVHVFNSDNREKPVHAVFNNPIHTFSIDCMHQD